MRRSIYTFAVLCCTILFSQVALARVSPEVLSFDAKRNGKKIDLTWESQNAVLATYTIERSKDGVTWERFINVKGASKKMLLNYIESDFKPMRGMSYYRLRVDDGTGQTLVSTAVPVLYARNPKFTKNLFPHPYAPEDIDMKKVTNKPTLVVLRDVHGKEHHTKVVMSTEKRTLIGISMEAALPKGTYLIAATSNDLVYAKHMQLK